MTKIARPSLRKGFTLIELLIVVAIIAILAAIAVPNFLEAQTRAKVSRTLSDMRSMRTALEAYRVDENKYPETDQGVNNLPRFRAILRITTPIAFMTAIPGSSFKEEHGAPGGSTKANPARKIATELSSYLYVERTSSLSEFQSDRLLYIGNANILPPAQQAAITAGGFYHMKSVGPDNLDDADTANPRNAGVTARVYDPTNGTVSRGDILNFSDRSGTGKNI